MTAARVLAVLFAAAALLIGVEFGKGAAHAGEVRLADPCARNTFKGSIVQRILLDGLDGAACRLHISREELVLSVGSNSPLHTRWDQKTIEAALRSGMLRAVREAARRGEIPSALAAPIVKFIRTAPIDKLVSGGISLKDLFAP
jgi:hypothetical protein